MTVMTSAVVTYKGKDRRGTARTGSTTETPIALIERLHKAGWLWAIAERGGIEVGGLGFDEYTHEDHLWGESE